MTKFVIEYSLANSFIMKRIIYLVLVFMLFGVVVYAQDSTRLKAKEVIFTVVEKMPQFPGGKSELMHYINSHIRYPAIAMESGISGTVLVRFVIDKEGVVLNPEVIRILGGGCDGEAIRIIKAMPKWIPGTQNGVPVSVWYTLPIRFSIAK